MKRKELEEHVTIRCEWRVTECEHCREPHPACHMRDHVGKCNKFPVACPSNCGDSFLRGMIADHTENHCPLSLVSCSYVQFGCYEKVQGKNLKSHLQSAMQEHLDLACAQLNNTHVQLSNTQETTRKLEGKVKALERRLEGKGYKDQEDGTVTRFIWKIDKFSDILRQAKAGGKNKIESSTFYTESYGYKLKVTMSPNGSWPTGWNTHLSVYIVVMKGEYEAILPWPFKKKVTFTLIDQQEDSVKRENVVTHIIPENHKLTYFLRPKEEENASCGEKCFISHEELQTGRYLVEDVLFLQVEIGPP